MSNPSLGGAFIPAADYNVSGTWTHAGTDTFSGTTSFTGPTTIASPVITGTPTTTANVGVAGTGVTAVEKGSGPYHQTVLTLTAVAMAISDTHVGGGSLIYTFPEGNISVLGATCTVAETTTSTLASTLNASSTLSVGVGSVQTTTQDSGTLVTTQQDIVNAFSATASATINVAGAAANGKISATTLLRYDGTSAAQAVYLNCGVPTGTDIDGDATTTWSGTVTISWMWNGDY